MIISVCIVSLSFTFLKSESRIISYKISNFSFALNVTLIFLLEKYLTSYY